MFPFYWLNEISRDIYLFFHWDDSSRAMTRVYYIQYIISIQSQTDVHYLLLALLRYSTIKPSEPYVYDSEPDSNRCLLNYPKCVLQMFIKYFTILLASSLLVRILLALSGGPDIVPRIIKLFISNFQWTYIENMEGLEPPSYQPDLIENWTQINHPCEMCLYQLSHISKHQAFMRNRTLYIIL